jgi:hypothetical protein
MGVNLEGRRRRRIGGGGNVHGRGRRRLMNLQLGHRKRE